MTSLGPAYPDMSEAGIFAPIDYGLWDPESIPGLPPQARLQDATIAYSYSMVLAYDQRAFPNGGPKNWVEFWDVKNFPGPRGLYASEAKFNYVAALIAAGIAPNDIWPLTDDKLEHAFDKLNEIKPHVAKWWAAGGEAPQLLVNREYAVTSMYDGRAISAASKGVPIKFIWDGAYLLPVYSVILKGAPNAANAQKRLAFMNRAQIAAGFTQATGYPAPNVNQLKYLPAEFAALLSVNPEKLRSSLLRIPRGLSRAGQMAKPIRITSRSVGWRGGHNELGRSYGSAAILGRFGISPASGGPRCRYLEASSCWCPSWRRSASFCCCH